MNKHGGKRTPGPGKRIGRPRLKHAKQPVSMKLPPDVLAYLRSTGNVPLTIEDMTRRTRGFRKWKANR